MTPPDLSHVSNWVFDLDNTLYPSDADVMSQVDRRMTEYVARELNLSHADARKVQKDYWREYGTTLNGLMANGQVRNGREFLDFVHDIDHSVITPDPQLAEHIRALPGRRYVYTNGSMKHAEDICHHLGLTDCFDDMFDVEAADFKPKPHRSGYDLFSSRFDIKAPESAFFEDSIRNLKTAHEMGWTTILVRARPGPRDEESAGPDDHPDHVHFAVDCLKTFLATAKTKDKAA
ncbi:pyrimidine 5'-nucleotidase [Hyphobacterium sp.]|uniref:pyrimidine 5'-nucleotidase n=1 Tax=Hyphobacterium sp. TaxID=2004662 RepID=UPI0037494F88